MSLPHALLTALAERPCSGLELAGRFDRSIGFFWHATHQQIYRELARLEAAGWVQSTAVEQSRGRKRNYELLPAGRKELKRWVVAGDDPKPLRDELMVRLRVALHEEKLATYQAIEAKDFADPDASREDRLRHLVLRAGLMQEAMWIELAREAIAILES